MATEDTSVKPEDTDETLNSGPDMTGADETPNEDVTGDTTEVVTEPASDEDEDALEAYYKARRAREALEQEDENARVQRLVEEEIRRRRSQERDETEAQARNAAYQETVRNIYTTLKSRKFYDEDGEETTISDQDVQAVINQVNTMNSRQKEVIGAALSDRLAEEALSRLPVDVRDQFAKDASNLDIGEWLVRFAEMYAPKTKHSQKLEADREVAIRAAEARGRRTGQKDPAGSPPTAPEAGAAKPVVQYNLETSAYDRARALRNGDISEVQFRELERKARNGL